MLGRLNASEIRLTTILFESMFTVNDLLASLLGVLTEKCDEPASESPQHPDGSANHPCQPCVHHCTLSNLMLWSASWADNVVRTPAGGSRPEDRLHHRLRMLVYPSGIAVSSSVQCFLWSGSWPAAPQWRSSPLPATRVWAPRPAAGCEATAPQVQEELARHHGRREHLSDIVQAFAGLLTHQQGTGTRT